jgi:hypothetical protein
LITVVNAEHLFEGNRELPSLHAWWELTVPEPRTESSLMAACRTYAAGRSQEAQAFLNSAETSMLFYQRWDQLNSVARAFRALARRDSAGKRITSSNESVSSTPNEILLGGELLAVTVHIVPDADGCGDYADNQILKALIGTKLDHIRGCRVCHQVFWAPRSNSETCSVKCRNVYNQWTSRRRRGIRARRKGKQ